MYRVPTEEKGGGDATGLPARSLYSRKEESESRHTNVAGRGESPAFMRIPRWRKLGGGGGCFTGQPVSELTDRWESRRRGQPRGSD